MRRILGWTVVLGAAAAAFVLLVFVRWLGSDDFQRFAQARTEQLLEQRTGEEVSLSRVDVRFWPPGVEAKGVNLWHAPTGDTIFAVERLLAPVVLTWSGPRLGIVQLVRPRVQLHLDPDGLRELRNRRRGGRPLRRFPLDGLDVVDGTVRLVHPAVDVTLRGLELHPRGGGVHQLDADLHVRSDRHEETHALALRPVLEDDRIRLPDLDLRTGPLDLRGTVDVPLQGDLAADLTLHARLATLTPWLAPPRALHGDLHADVEVRGPPNNPTAAINAWTTDLALDLPGRKTPVLHYRFDETTLAVEATRDRVVVEDLVAYWAGGTLRATGLIDPASRALVDARVVGEGVSFRDLLVQLGAAPTPWIDMACDAEIRASGSLQPLHVEGSFELDTADLLVTAGPVREPGHRRMLDIPFAFARGDLTLEKDHIRLVAHEVQGPGTRGFLDVDIGFAGSLDLVADLNADLADFQPLGGVQMSGRGPIRGRIRGPFQHLTFEGTGDIEQFSILGRPLADRLTAPVFRSDDLRSLELLGATAVKGGTTYAGDFRMDFRPPVSLTTALAVADGRVEDLLGVFVDVDFTGDVDGSLALDGPLYRMNGRADLRLADTSLLGERFPTGRARGVMSDGRFRLDDLVLARRANEEGIRLRGTVGRGWSLDMDLLADGFRLEALDRLADDVPLRGTASAYAHIGHTLFEPEPAGRIVVRDARYAGSELADSEVRFTTSAGILSYDGNLLGDAVTGSGTLGLWGTRPFTLAADLRDVPVHVLHPVAEDGRPITATATGDLRIATALADPSSPLQADGKLTDVTVAWGPHVLRNQAPWTYRQDGAAYTLENMDLTGGTTRFAVEASGGERFTLAGDGVVALDLLRAVVPGLERAEGEAEVDLQVAGDATLALVDVRADLLRHDALPAALEDLTTQVRLAPDGFRVTDLRASLGGGTFRGGGSIDAEGWTPVRYDLAGAVTDAQVRWVDSLPAAVGDAVLRLDGPADALLLEGDVTIDEMVFADRIDWEDWVVEYRSEVMVQRVDDGDDGPFDLNVRIGADRTIRLRNNLAEGTASADLRVVGTPTRPGILGTIRIDDAVVVLQDRTFRVDRGEVTYTDPFTWDPDLGIDLVTDIESRERRYRIDYQLYGPFSDWRTTTRSDPALPQADVNALLWFGVTTEDLERAGELPTAVAQGVADLLLTDLFASTQASELGEVPELLFDSIDVATGVNGRGEYSAEPRLVVSKRLEDLGDVDLTWEFNLGRPEDNYVRVDKRVGGIWSIAGWYATLQRERVLPIGGAYGVDVTARWEIE